MRLSFSNKIVAIILATGIGAIVVGGGIGFVSGIGGLSESINSKLTAQREIKRLWIESYINDQARFAEAIGTAPSTVRAAAELTEAFRVMRAEVTADATAMERDKTPLARWYETKFFPMVEAVTGGRGDAEGIMPTDPVARRLQADYLADAIAGRPADAGTRYDVAHRNAHQSLYDLTKTIGFRNVSLVDAVTGDVVYATTKEADFATNLTNGPFRNSGLALAARRAVDPTRSPTHYAATRCG